MVRYLFTNCAGTFLFDENGTIVEHKEISEPDLIRVRKGDLIQQESRILDKHSSDEIHIVNRKTDTPGSGKTSPEMLHKILENFKDAKYFSQYHSLNLAVIKHDIKQSIEEDLFILQSINLVGDIDKAINQLSKRLREWYGLYVPEYSRSEPDTEQFIESILVKDKNELLTPLNINPSESMGADLSAENIYPLLKLAEQIKALHVLRKEQAAYIEKVMNRRYPNLSIIAGTIIGAKLISHAGSFKNLAGLPSSTIQLLGAEKALFRHLHNRRALPPKYGVLHEHPLIQSAAKKDHGKIARALADKLCIAVKVDYFKGAYIGDKLLKDLEKKFSASR